MSIRKHNLPKVVLALCLIGLIAFKDTGMFVSELVAVDKDADIYEIPANMMIKTHRISQRYELINNTMILDKPSGTGLRIFCKGEIFQLLKYEDEYGLFQAEDGMEGYIAFTDLEPIVEESFTYGISKVNKLVKNEDFFYTLVKGEIVYIKEFKEDNYVIVDKDGIEFTVESENIELKRSRQLVNRGGYSKKSISISKVVKSAYNKLDEPYVYSDTGKKGYDCSGLTYSIYLDELGIKLGRSSISQAKDGVQVSREELIPGDLVFFKTSGKNIGHAGLYVGEGNMIHASSGQNKVMITNIDESNYYTSRYVTARRIIR